MWAQVDVSFSAVQLLQGADSRVFAYRARSESGGGVSLARGMTQWLLDTGRERLRQAAYAGTATSSRLVLYGPFINKELLNVAPKCGFNCWWMTSNRRIDNERMQPRVGRGHLSETAV